uniref:Uncharacterized protein n=1 Tax=Cacopsylla melanoneura TaxID=428564 RepID=A0A8D9BKT1_9HEMI
MIQRRNSKRFILSELSDLNNNGNVQEEGTRRTRTRTEGSMNDPIPSIHIHHIREDEGDDDDDDCGIVMDLEVEALPTPTRPPSPAPMIDYMDLPPSQVEISQWQNPKSLRAGMR